MIDSAGAAAANTAAKAAAQADANARNAAARAVAKELTKEQGRNDRTPPDSRLPSGHIWRYDKILGEGGQGVAHLWTQVDKDDNVVDRVVVKNFHIRPEIDVIVRGPGRGQIREAFVPQQLLPSGTEPKDQFTVATLAVQPLPGMKAGWRTYAPFYSMGSLYHLTGVQPPNRPFPEPFIWYTFWRLAKGLVAMDEKLRAEGATEPVVGHNDLKPDNVFLGHPGSLGKDADYILYPPAYIGDFGTSYLTSETRPVGHGGTPGSVVPENMLDESRQLVLGTYCHSKSNVWGIASIILLAMEGTLYRDQRPAREHIKYDTERSKKRAPAWSGYSKQLIRTVESCLHPTMNQRPSPQDLVTTIESYMEQFQGGMKRWGTSSWIANLHDEIQAVEYAAIAPPGQSTSNKRISSAPFSEPKRLKSDEKKLKARHSHVAWQILYGASVNVDSEPFQKHPHFILPEAQRIVYAKKYPPLVRPIDLFSTPDPGPVEFEPHPDVFMDWIDGLNSAQEAELWE